MSKTKYPRTLYKSPGNLVWKSNGVKKTYDSLLVNNSEEQKAAEQMGYADDFSKALFDPPVKVERERGNLDDLLEET